MTVFLTAAEARAKATDDTFIFNEVKSLETKVLTAVNNGELSLRTSDTPMTDADGDNGDPTQTAKDFYSVWQNLTTDRVKEQQMQAVIDHFVQFGYSIVRLKNPTTLTTFDWEIKW